jgi:hypothetical protein
VTTRTNDVADDEQNPLSAVTVTVAEGQRGSARLYEDDGTTTAATAHATTAISYARHTVRIGRPDGSFRGQVAQRDWTVTFTNATAPTVVRVNGHRISADAWTWDPGTRTLTVHAPRQRITASLVVSYR